MPIMTGNWPLLSRPGKKKPKPAKKKDGTKKTPVKKCKGKK